MKPLLILLLLSSSALAQVQIIEQVPIAGKETQNSLDALIRSYKVESNEHCRAVAKEVSAYNIVVPSGVSFITYSSGKEEGVVVIVNERRPIIDLGKLPAAP